jgi:hypothetical protein
MDVSRDTPVPQLNPANHGSWNTCQTGQMDSNPKWLPSPGVRSTFGCQESSGVEGASGTTRASSDWPALAKFGGRKFGPGLPVHPVIMALCLHASLWGRLTSISSG